MATALRRRPATFSMPESVAILFGLVLAYACASVIAPAVFRGGWNLYAVQPTIWLGLAYWCLYNRPDARPSWPAMAPAMFVAVFHVAVLVLAGVLLGFGTSPYSHEVLAIAGNLVYLGAFLAGFEAARWRLLQALPGRGLVALALVALVFAVLDVPFGQLRSAAVGDTNPVTLSGQMLLPSAGESWLATMLAVTGGPYAALLYRGALAGAEWLSPILPALGGVQAAVIGAFAPASAALALRPAGEPADETAAPDEARSGVPAWVLTAGVVIVGLIWLNTGLLGVQPAVVTGISMEPTLTQGDIVFTREVALRSLEVGDLIRFQEGGVPVIHRIKAIQSSSGDLVFITQGDNNAFEDPPVVSSAVEGKVVATLPWIGSIPIEARRMLGR